jgi:hypothetical protein
MPSPPPPRTLWYILLKLPGWSAGPFKTIRNCLLAPTFSKQQQLAHVRGRVSLKHAQTNDVGGPVATTATSLTTPRSHPSSPCLLPFGRRLHSRKTWPLPKRLPPKTLCTRGMVSESSPCFRILYIANALSSLIDNQPVGYPNSDEIIYRVSFSREGERPTMSTHVTSRYRCYYTEAWVRLSARRHPGDDAAVGGSFSGKVAADYYRLFRIGAAAATVPLAEE